MPEYKEELITKLDKDEVIVIGSNKRGMHAAGAANYAFKHFGLKWGVGEGLSGQTYALPTMEGLASFADAVAEFLRYAELSPDLTFFVTRVGCGIAGYPEALVQELFVDLPENVKLPPEWTLPVPLVEEPAE